MTASRLYDRLLATPVDYAEPSRCVRLSPIAASASKEWAVVMTAVIGVLADAENRLIYYVTCPRPAHIDESYTQHWNETIQRENSDLNDARRALRAAASSKR